jgi:micrococcal nuclease
MALRVALLGVAIAVSSLLGAASATGGETGRFYLKGRVTSVIDGDTINVRLRSGKRERVRLIGIDSPELRPLECFARQARTRARQLAQGKNVRLIGDPTQDTRDRYRRLLAYVILPGNRDLGRQLIVGGFAKVYVYDRRFQRLGAYRTSERAAQAATRGLWGGCGVSPPPPPPPPPGPPPPPPGGTCHASYPDVCIPPAPPDLDCGDISYRNFRVRHDVADPDPHGFDGDRDGVGCES